MMLNATYDGDEPTLDKALMIYRKETTGITPTESLIKYFNTGEYTDVWSYARYWHGYLIYLKPLLLCMDYGNMRILNSGVQILLNVLIIFLLYKKKLSEYILPYILATLLLMPIVIGMSLQYSSVFYIYTIGCILLLYKVEKWKYTHKYIYFFFIIGILTSYFDLLTYPLLTFGMPFILYVCINRDPIIKVVLNNIKFLLCWGFGYIGMWMGKWIIATMFTGENIILDALNSIVNRSSMNDLQGNAFSLIDVIHLNITEFLQTPIIILVVMYILICLFLIIKRDLAKDLANNFIALSICVLLPFIWYMGASNHSYIHFWFTYRELTITAFSLMCICAKTLHKNQDIE